MQLPSTQCETASQRQPSAKLLGITTKCRAGIPLFVACLIWSGCSNTKTAPDPESNKPQKNANSNIESSTESDTNFDQLAKVEAFQEIASSQLKNVDKWIQSNRKNETLLSSITATDYQASEFDVEQLTTLRETGFRVQKLARTTENKKGLEPTTSSSVTTWNQLLSPLTDATGQEPSEQRSKFKITRVDLTGNTAETEVIVAAFAKFKSGTSAEINCTLQLKWTYPADKEKPLIQSIVVKDYESAQYKGTEATTFTDRTADLLNQDANLVSQFSYGTEYWISRLMYGDYAGHFGLAVGDINGDGRDDIYMCQPAGLPNRLLVQQPDGRIVDQSSEAGLDILDQTRSALFVDLDNDGDQDLLVAASSFLLVFENDGSTKLKLREKLFEARSAYSLSAADFDNDGDLDIYACAYNALFGAGPFPFAYPFHDANNGGRNVLYENDGQGNLRDVTDAVGLDQNNQRFSMAAAWEDFDLDGDMDLYVANDFGRNSLYQNTDGQFENVAKQQGVEDQSFGMSVDWSDVNHDNHPDLYVSNMFSSAGNRVSFQTGYMSRQPELQSRVQYMARGNSLFLGANSFEDASIESNTWMGRWAWSSKFVDLDNDSWDDVVVANGYLTRKLSDDL